MLRDIRERSGRQPGPDDDDGNEEEEEADGAEEQRQSMAAPQRDTESLDSWQSRPREERLAQ
eukprot:1465881-Rhodomonas_salina.1